MKDTKWQIKVQKGEIKHKGFEPKGEFSEFCCLSKQTQRILPFYSQPYMTNMDSG